MKMTIAQSRLLAYKKTARTGFCAFKQTCNDKVLLEKIITRIIRFTNGARNERLPS
jgi:hypothetical protein